MKRVLYIVISLNLVGWGKTFADDSLTGLHLGFGLNVVADEYKSDVDVLGIAKYASGEKWTFNGPRFEKLELEANAKLQYDHVDQGTNYYSYSINNIITATFAEALMVDTSTWRTLEFTGPGAYNIVDFGYTYDEKTDGSTYTSKDGHEQNYQIKYFENGNYYQLLNSCMILASNGYLTAAFVNDIITTGTSNRLIYGDKAAEEITPISTSGGITSAYLNTSRQLKARTNKIGGELKMSYFHNLTDHVVLGVDVCGTLNQKAKKNIEIDKLNYTASGSTANSEYKISYDDTYAIYKDGKCTGTNADSYNDDTVTGFFKTVTENGTTYIPERQYTIESVGGSSVDTSQIIADNPDYTALEAQPSDTSQYLQISNEKGGDVSFEKNKFNSRAAVVLGAQYKGWFAGTRGGISYNQGKLHVKDSTGTSSEEVSFASPFVGVHLMKSVNMKGLENGHIYVTADVNVQNKQNLKMKGIKNFRQNSVNVSLGMTWQIN